jgi:hypothetical protein
MSGYRFEIDAQAGPAREAILYGRAIMLVRVSLFDGPGVISTDTGQPCPQEEVFTYLRPEDARSLAFTLLSAAEEAERQTRAARYWQRQARA